MRPPGGSARLLARFNPGSTHEEGLAFVQQRLALFQKCMLVALIVFLAFVNVIYSVYPEARPSRAALVNYVAVGGLCVLVGLIWRTTRRRVMSSRTLLVVDVVMVVGISAGFTVAATAADDQEINVYAALIWMAYTVLARSLIVPSTPRQTAILTFIGLAPAIGAGLTVDLSLPTIPLVAGVVMLLVVLVTLATIGSQVIYGLRSQVRQAMQLGQYTILDEIGEGGMGTVYRARHAMLRRPTAVKLLKPDRTVGHLARFEREVQATAELAHPNTVAIYDYGRSPDGVFYYAMEYLDGVDLGTLIKRDGAQPWQRVVHVLRQVCGALEEAHATGLIHRDIKPGNIILCRRGGIPDVAKVVDFGLVKDLEAAGASSSGNVVAGTPGYVAPEAVIAPDRVGPAIDLYALGAVAYFLLTGEPVFSASSPVELCMMHVDLEPTPPSQRTDNGIPAGLEQLVLQCLAKDPDNRPVSAYALKRALDDLSVADPWSEERADEWWLAYDADRPARPARPSPSSVTTMTVDVASRTKPGYAPASPTP